MDNPVWAPLHIGCFPYQLYFLLLLSHTNQTAVLPHVSPRCQICAVRVTAILCILIAVCPCLSVHNWSVWACVVGRSVPPSNIARHTGWRGGYSVCTPWRTAVSRRTHTGFEPRSVYVGFVVNKVTLRLVFLRVLWFLPVSVIPQCCILNWRTAVATGSVAK